MVVQDLRQWLTAVEEMGELELVRGADPHLEIGALCELWGSDAQALLFDEIKGFPSGMRVVTNACNSVGRLALTLGLPRVGSKMELIREIRKWYGDRRRIPPKPVHQGPVLENVLTGDAADIRRFPAPIWHELDGGPYIGTADLVIMRDPDSDWVNVGTYRAQVYDDGAAGVVPLGNKHGRIIMERYWARGQACPVAISVGHDPLLFVLSGMEAPYGVNELEYAGGLKGQPIEVIEGPATGLPIPAHSELVIEGEIAPGDERMEGPFGEWSGYYVFPETMQPVVRVKSILHRNNPIILGGMPGPRPSDNTYFRCHFKAAEVWNQLEAAGLEGVRGVWQHLAGGSRLFLVVSIKQLHAGHAKEAGFLATFCRSSAYTGRFTVVVDDDIDPSDSHALIWALATRVDPQHAIHIVKDCWACPSDTMFYPPDGRYPDIYVSRVVIDACRPWDRRETFPPVAEASDALKERILRDWKDLLARRRNVP